MEPIIIIIISVAVSCVICIILNLIDPHKCICDKVNTNLCRSIFYHKCICNIDPLACKKGLLMSKIKCFHNNI